jgi:1-acyl-sn-glycerol-3-phosphate acyltransferase
MSPLSRDLLRQAMRGLFKILTRVRVEGLENVPDKGGCIIAVNHFSRLDPPRCTSS